MLKLLHTLLVITICLHKFESTDDGTMDGVIKHDHQDDSDDDHSDGVEPIYIHPEPSQANDQHQDSDSSSPSVSPTQTVLMKKLEVVVTGPVMKNGEKIGWNPAYANLKSREFAELTKTVCSLQLHEPLVLQGCKILSAREGSTVAETLIIVTAPENMPPLNILNSIKDASPELNSPELILNSTSESIGYLPEKPNLKTKEDERTLVVTWSNRYDTDTNVVFNDVSSGRFVYVNNSQMAMLPIEGPYKFNVYAQNQFGKSETVTISNGKDLSHIAIIIAIIGIILIALLLICLIICCLSIYWSKKKSYPAYVPQYYQEKVNIIFNKSATIRVDEKRAEFDSYSQRSQPPSYVST